MRILFLVSDMINKLWRDQTAGALQPRVNNVLLTKVVQDDASITLNKLRKKEQPLPAIKDKC